MARRNSADVDQAAAEFRRAVELDPEFALAWVGVSESAMLQSQYSDLGFKESREIQQQATERALARGVGAAQVLMAVAAATALACSSYTLVVAPAISASSSSVGIRPWVESQ